MIDRATSAANGADDQRVEREVQPRTDWNEFCVARERLFARLRHQSELYLLERAWKAPPHSGLSHAAPLAAPRRFLP